MKLHDVKPKTYVKVGQDTVFFDHIDGMYSLCKDMQGKTVHLAAWSEVEIDDLNTSLDIIVQETEII